MENISVLEKVLEFMELDLSRERLSYQTDLKKNDLIEILKEVITNSKQSCSLPQLPEELPANHVYLYPDNMNSLPTNYINSDLERTGSDESGSGYESYSSDEDMASTPSQQQLEEENIEQYFAGTNSLACGLIFLENKTLISGKKWTKCVGTICAGKLQCFKKLGDERPVLNIFLKKFKVLITTKGQTSSVVFNLKEVGNEPGSHRFHVAKNKTAEWCRAIESQCLSLIKAESLPTASRDNRTPGSSSDLSHRKTQRPVSFAGVTDIGKGLKSAMSDIFKKDKLKKKISVAKQMGASLCGNLGVYAPVNEKWTKKLCLIKDNQLFVYGKEETPEQTILLSGCDLQPYFGDPEKKFAFKLIRNEKEILFVEASSSFEMGKWVGMLIAETGCAKISQTTNVYVSLETHQTPSSNACNLIQTKAKINNSATQEIVASKSLANED